MIDERTLSLKWPEERYVPQEQINYMGWPNRLTDTRETGNSFAGYMR